MSQDVEARKQMFELAKVTREGFTQVNERLDQIYTDLGAVRTELRGDIARLANMTGAGFETMHLKFKSVDDKLDRIVKSLEDLQRR